EYQYDVEKWLNSVDADLSQFNTLAAHLTWKLSTFPDEKTSQQARQLGKVRNRWKNKVCESTIRHDWTTPEQRRKIYLMCRGPKFTDQAVLEYLEVLGKLAQEYNSEVCLIGAPTCINRTAPNFPKTGDCLYGEPDLERIMKRTDLAPDQLKWIWLNWHNAVGPKLKDLFRLAIDYQNEAAKNNGYDNIGEVWREELETPHLEKFVFGLYEEVEPLYVMLHAVVRHKLFRKYGPSEIDPKGPIPTHLLGNMWGQDWASLMDLFEISQKNINLDEKLQTKNLTVKDLDGTTTAFHESIGDAIMHGVMTPQHLHRLSLLSDDQLSDNNTELFLLFQQALSKIPEIPFSLIVDKYRWDIFKGAIPYEEWNDYFWYLNKKYRGIVPPENRNSRYFDAGAKFHIPDNTPYIRYFLSSIIQMQIFKSICELSLYGKTSEGGYEENNLPLHKCDIYGSKNGGKKLLAMMEKGSSVRWPEALSLISGTPYISTKPFLEYYKPIYRWLKQYVELNNVYVG
ncbi:angiotensin-converting enzyme-like, partial [Asbolus verrucosus]